MFISRRLLYVRKMNFSGCQNYRRMSELSKKNDKNIEYKINFDKQKYESNENNQLKKNESKTYIKASYLHMYNALPIQSYKIN